MKTKSIKINWAAILAFCTFWTYAFYAAVSTSTSGLPKSFFNSVESILFFLGSSLILSAVFVFFLVMYFYKKKSFEDEFKYTTTDRNVLIVYCASMLWFSWPELNSQINGDQFAHSMMALIQSAQATYILAKHLPFIQNFEFKNVLYLVNIILLIGSCTFIYVINKVPNSIKIITYLIFFLSLRFIIIYLGKGFQDGHPSFRLFPIWLSASIFHPSNFALRLPQIFGLITLMFVSYRFASNYFSITKAIFFGFAIGTIPILWHVGILVECSIWSSLCATYLLYCLIHKAIDENYTFNLMRISSVISVSILLRQPNIACIFLLIAILTYSYYYESKHSLKKTILYLSPLLISLPFVIKSILVGTPSTNAALADSGSLHQVIFSVTSKIGLYSMLNGVLYWILFIPFVLLIYKKNRIICLSILLFLLVDYIQFYSIDKIYWGVGRYQAEYVIPFVIIGFFLLLYHFAGNMYIYLPLCILLISINTYLFKNISSLNKPNNDLKYSCFYDNHGSFGITLLSEYIFPYNHALTAVKNSGHSGDVYIYGTVYGVLPQILAGYTVKNIVLNNQNWEKLRNKGMFQYQDQNSAKKINENKNVKIALFSGTQDFQAIISYLKTNGWSDWKTFYDKKYRSSIVGLIRNPDL